MKWNDAYMKKERRARKKSYDSNRLFASIAQKKTAFLFSHKMKLMVACVCRWMRSTSARVLFKRQVVEFTCKRFRFDIWRSTFGRFSVFSSYLSSRNPLPLLFFFLSWLLCSSLMATQMCILTWRFTICRRAFGKMSCVCVCVCAHEWS